MSGNVSDFLSGDGLSAKWGDSRVLFGYPGDGINGIMGALNRAAGQLEFIQVRHKKSPLLWLARMPSLPVKPAFVWQLQGLERFIY